MANAIEHGSEYGERGPVTFTFKTGTLGVVAIVEDPGQGFDVSCMTAITDEPRLYTLQECEHQRYERHKGLKYLKKQEGFQCGFERAENLFRNILYFERKEPITQNCWETCVKISEGRYELLEGND